MSSQVRLHRKSKLLPGVGNKHITMNWCLLFLWHPLHQLPTQGKRAFIPRNVDDLDSGPGKVLFMCNHVNIRLKPYQLEVRGSCHYDRLQWPRKLARHPSENWVRFISDLLRCASGEAKISAANFSHPLFKQYRDKLPWPTTKELFTVFEVGVNVFCAKKR